MEEYIKIGTEKAIRLDEWKGNYSISQHRLYNDKWYWEAVRTVKGKDQVNDKNTPAKISLGDKQTAIGAIKTIIAELEGK